MLCQLVCVDRRYQRMNCFNIREVQSLLKRKFFTDLINTHDHHTLLNKTTMGVRFKTNAISTINSNSFVFYNYGIEFASKTRSANFLLNETTANSTTSFNTNSIFFTLIESLQTSYLFLFINNIYIYLFKHLYFLTNVFTGFKYVMESTLFFIINIFDIVVLASTNGINLLFSAAIIFSNFISNFSFTMFVTYMVPLSTTINTN
jgi:hypothetical protein